MSLTQYESRVFSAKELLTLDESLLVEHVKRNTCAEGGFDISSASGLDTLSECQ